MSFYQENTRTQLQFRLTWLKCLLVLWVSSTLVSFLAQFGLPSLILALIAATAFGVAIGFTNRSNLKTVLAATAFASFGTIVGSYLGVQFLLTPLYLYDHGDAETEKCAVIGASIGAFVGALLPRLLCRSRIVPAHLEDSRKGPSGTSSP